MPCTVTRVVDGDTLDCDPIGRIRLLGMDTPEPAQAPFGARATEALRAMAPPGTPLLAEGDVEARDRYGRALAYLWREMKDGPVQLNWALVRTGYAVLLTYPPNVRHVEAFTAAQAAARDEGVGLWAVDGFACIPRDFRARRCGR
ncbi:MAG: thermonuclease family protein [Longimicrobiales bacterium]|nr:thermonuclease family protein [Longimicrobiales bacterium]